MNYPPDYVAPPIFAHPGEPDYELARSRTARRILEAQRRQQSISATAVFESELQAIQMQRLLGVDPRHPNGEDGHAAPLIRPEPVESRRWSDLAIGAGLLIAWLVAMSWLWKS